MDILKNQFSKINFWKYFFKIYVKKIFKRLEIFTLHLEHSLVLTAQDQHDNK
jgi:hypothetical protein